MENKQIGTTASLFDGPFKVPLPKAKRSSTSSGESDSPSLKVPKPKYKKVDRKFEGLVYQKLLVKLIQSPESMTKYDMRVLSTHPVIRKLLKCTKNNDSYSNARFYLPIESLLNPNMYEDSDVPVILERQSCVTQTQNDSPKAGDLTLETSEKKDTVMETEEDASSESTSSKSEVEAPSERKIGKYTMKERQQKIQKYKKKLQAYKQKKQAKAGQKPRKYNKLQPRKNGRFASYPDFTEELVELINQPSTQPAQTCSSEYLHSDPKSENKSLNDIVSEITGIF